MSKTFKTVALIFVIILLGIMTYNLFFSVNNQQMSTASGSGDSDPPFWVSLLVSWFPMIVIMIFYVIFLQAFKQLVRIGERIAVALESKVKLEESTTD